MGNQSSQWFTLYYLDRLDRFIKERLKVKYYVRYMDDGVLIHYDKEFLKKALAKTQIFPISQGVDFLGFHFYLTDTGKVIKRLRTSNLKHGHTWKLRKHIYSNTIFTKSKEDSDEKIKA